MAPDDGVLEAATKALGAALLDSKSHVGEVTLTVVREEIANALKALRDTAGLEYQQLMEIAGVDYPDRTDRFEVVYHLLSLTRNRRIRVKLSTDEATPVPSVTSLWPVAGWLEREVFDMYGVGFAGNRDLRRILTDYGFEGHPQRKDFPLTGHVELRYSEAEKRVVYEPVSLPQDFRTFDFLMPWQNAEYVLPGDEKAAAPAPAPPAATTPKTTEKTADTGGGAPADAAAKRQARKPAKAKAASDALKPTDGTPAPKPRGTAKRKTGGAA
ncbi:MAG: NADH-quinone oxidoreductase subunit C [Sphingomicrobium sp.]